MGDFFEPIQTFFGHLLRALLLIVVAIVYLPAFVLTTLLNKPFKDMLENFGL